MEVTPPKGVDRARLQVIPDATRATLHGFIRDNIEPGSVILTDGLSSYPGLSSIGYTHKPFTVSGSGVKAHVALPMVHRVASLFKRSLLNAYQQYPKLHLQAYCDEWVFRFNRRRSGHRGMLFFRLMELAVQADPLRYEDLAKSTRPRSTPPVPPTGGGSPSLAQVNDATRPWRS